VGADLLAQADPSWYVIVNCGQVPGVDTLSGVGRLERAEHVGGRALPDSLEPILTLVVALLIAYAVVLWIGTAFWTYRDIRNRTADGWTQFVSVLLVVAFNLPGLLLYLVVRPQETLTEAYERRMEAEALMRDLPPPPASCPTCRQTVREDYLVCPNCKTRLRETCGQCAKPLELSWAACPYCGSAGPNAGAARAASTAPPSSTPPPKPAAEPSLQQRKSQPTPQAGSAQGHSPPPQPRPSAQPPTSESTGQSFWRRIVG
jgi:hypothetical protein